MKKYFKNFILCGDVEYYCLLCQELFQGTQDVEKHIRWEHHRKTLKNQTYFSKFRKDSIYKIENNFYCEICNVVSPDIATVTNHINNETHKAMKSNPTSEAKKFIGQYESGYIVINKVILNMAQWNSIVDKKCQLCNNTYVRKISEHLKTEEHIIKLIQSETRYEDERYYRKINEDKYHCFTCKKVFSAENFNAHWPNCENIDEIEINTLKEGASNKNIGKTTEEINKMADLEKQLICTLQDFYKLDEKNNSATCKHCNTVLPISFKSMIEHMKSAHNNQVPNESTNKKADDENSEDEVVYAEVTDYGKRRSELSKYGKENSIKLNYNGSKGWCFVCNRYLPAHKKNFKEHVRGIIHKGHLELQNLKNPPKQIRRDYKTKSILQCNLQYAPQHKEFCVSYDNGIDVYSFLFLLKIKDDKHFMKTNCFVCNELFPQGLERKHCETINHKNNFLAAKYIIVNSLHGEEFIREIRPNLFHCGFCNVTLPYFDTVMRHLDLLSHKMLKLEKTGFMPTIKIRTKADDVYVKLLDYAFANI